MSDQSLFDSKKDIFPNSMEKGAVHSLFTTTTLLLVQKTYPPSPLHILKSILSSFPLLHKVPSKRFCFAKIDNIRFTFQKFSYYSIVSIVTTELSQAYMFSDQIGPGFNFWIAFTWKCSKIWENSMVILILMQWMLWNLEYLGNTKAW